MLLGTLGPDILQGLGGDDTLDGQGGLDILNGGGGNDTATFAAAAGGLTAFLILGGVSTGYAAGVTFLSVENLIGSSFDDQLYGDLGINKLFGGAGNDTLYGWGAGDDFLFGGDGIDNVIGGSGREFMDGGAGVDTLSYQLSKGGVAVSMVNPGINTGDAAGDTYVNFEDVTGSNFNDIIFGDDQAVNNLWGLAGDDYLFGAGGYDVLIGDAGADYLDGGDGRDAADYETSVAPVTASLADRSINTGDAAGDTYVNVEDLTGGFANDTLYGDNGINNIIGLPGDDWIFANGGDDTLEGGPGADFLDGGAGLDAAAYATAGVGGGYIKPDADFKTLNIGVTASLLNPAINTGEAAGDTYANIENLIGSPFADSLQGDDAANTILGNAGNDFLQGAGGIDVLDGGPGSDVLFGGDGDDLLYGGTGADLMDGGAGLDTITYDRSATAVTVSLDTPSLNTGDAAGDTCGNVEALYGSAFSDVLFGYSSAPSLLYGGDGNDQLIGGAASDMLVGGAGADILNGGAGIDAATYFLSSAGVVVNMLSAGSGGDAAGDTYIGIENLIGSPYGDILAGDNGANVVLGGDGNDYLFGNGGDDSFQGGQGADYFSGGAGIDVVSYASETAPVAIFMAAPGLNGGPATGDSYDGIENIVGTSLSDIIYGSGDGNALFGGLGNDILAGGAGDDLLSGGADRDQLIGGDGYDYASYASATAGVVAFLAGAQLNSLDAAGDTYDSVEGLLGSPYADFLAGDAGSNTIQGNGGSDLIYGGPGGDLLVGGEGDDLLDGGAGFDILDGGNGIDAVYYNDAPAGVHADLKNPSSNTGDALNDQYRGIENMWGSPFDDTLGGDEGVNGVYGLDGNDQINGYGGNDLMWGGAGGDVVTGGAGSDVFIFVQPSEGGDIVSDFTRGADIISLSSFWFALGGAAGPIDPARFASGVAPAAANAVASFLFDTTAHQLFYDPDGSGAAAPIVLATFANGISLTAGDIWQG